MQAVHRKTLMTSRDPRDRNGKHSPGREGARKFYMMADESCIYYTCLLCLGHLRPKYAWKTHFVRRRSNSRGDLSTIPTAAISDGGQPIYTVQRQLTAEPEMHICQWSYLGWVYCGWEARSALYGTRQTTGSCSLMHVFCRAWDAACPMHTRLRSARKSSA